MDESAAILGEKRRQHLKPWVHQQENSYSGSRTEGRSYTGWVSDRLRENEDRAETARGEPAQGCAGGEVAGGGLRRVLGLDVGNRRIGLALTDALGITAQPLFTLQRTTLRADLKSIGRVVRKYEVREIVIGLPLHSSGEMSEQAVKMEAFGAALVEAIPGLVVHWMDERLTTAEAHRLLDGGRGGRSPGCGSKAARKERFERTRVVDQVAAVLLLEAFLSVRAPRLLPDPDEEYR